MFATAEEIVASGCVYGVRTIAQAREYLQRTLDAALNNKQGNKDNRPWHIVDFSKRLDPTQPWVGFEFETGFDDKQEYQKFIRWLWKHKHVAIDREGTGKYPVEVAFPPQELRDMLKNKHLLLKCVEFVHRAKMTPALNPTTFTRRDVGIHAGISTPKFRSATYMQKVDAVYALSAILGKLSVAQKKEIYGRSALHWGTAYLRETYVELKMFKAIPEVAHVKRCIGVTVRCIDLLDWCLDNPHKKLTGEQGYNYLSGKTNEIGE